jgi:hypothetical protein
MSHVADGNGNGTGVHAADLASFDMLEQGEEPQPLQIAAPDGTIIGADVGKPATVYVLSYYGQTMVDWMDEQNDRAIKSGKIPKSKDTRERNIATTARTLMARPWENVEWAGEPLAFNLTNAKMLMTRLPFAKRQVDEKASQETAYLGNSSGRSPSSEGITSDSPSGPKVAASPSENG